MLPVSALTYVEGYKFQALAENMGFNDSINAFTIHMKESNISASKCMKSERM